MKYIPFPGEQCLPQPGNIKNALFYVFLLEASIDKLTNICENYFNSIADDTLSYIPCSRYVLLSHVDIGSLSSAQKKHGAIAYKDIALWMPLAVVDNSKTLPVVKRIAFFPLYIIVDNAQTMVTGRETFGLAKQMGWFDIPTSPSHANYFRTEVVGRQSSQTFTRRSLLWEVEKQNTANHFSTMRDMGKMFVDMLFKDAPGFPTADLISGLQKQGSVLGLKQFRSCTHPEKACYQSIIETPVVVNDFLEGGYLGNNYQFTVHDLATHPLQEIAGVQNQKTTGFWFRANLTMKNGQEVWRSSQNNTYEKHKRIAILGGGMSSLTAAYELSDPARKDNYDITVYLPGWRLGGKGASGRNRKMGDRIEEHGLHVWYGFYDNAFRLIQRCYKDNNRVPQHPFATWQQAFTKQSYFILNENHKGRWVKWRMRFRENDLVPGIDPLEMNLWSGTELLLEWLLGIYESLAREKVLHLGFTNRDTKIDWDKDFIGTVARGIKKALQVPVWLLLKASYEMAKAQRVYHKFRGGKNQLNVLATNLNRFKNWLWPFVEKNIDHDELRRFWILLDHISAVITGVVADNLIENGLASIDHLDLREWLHKHGAKKYPTLTQSPSVRFIYNAAFAFVDGDTQKADFSAGAGLRGMLRLFCTHKGAVVYKMNAGMGDIVFTPMYEVLKKRGVQFKFFHSVTNIGLTEDQKSIDTIQMVKQVQLKTNEYDPVVDIGGALCWPSSPCYEQIVAGEKLQKIIDEEKIDIEHRSRIGFGWEHDEEVSIKQGEDFDEVILGISIGALPKICPELIDANKRWQNMISSVKTVATQAYQFWFRKNLQQLGGNEPTFTMGTYADPVDTYSDMSHLCAVESGDKDGSIAYFCGVVPDKENENREQAQQRSQQLAKQYFKENAHYFWPGTIKNGKIDWSLLVDPNNREGEKRFDAQYYRINSGSSERYVLSVAGSNKYRLRCDESGFRHLYLTGDWTNNNFNCGCIEASVMSGMQVARAISGEDIQICDENDEWLAKLFGK
ncbi:NAD(P)-binding protein [Candidatus Uabimicrobium amorphum]|uniref:Membrane protein n=1 Tax=Uabimicrobium amorphum TaxID=2596890 RepID=A0A5S9IIF3_UABAM|nr:NAD(P)-binding protein [Candidatus Uabimicrobium amorphum]BBM82066.1 membrane protein [Candidatus Uabimicrobium amorphum]